LHPKDSTTLISQQPSKCRALTFFSLEYRATSLSARSRSSPRRRSRTALSPNGSVFAPVTLFGTTHHPRACSLWSLDPPWRRRDKRDLGPEILLNKY
ncbi:hypothetical protein CI238_03073, partial [Colletotrichum incanum]